MDIFKKIAIRDAEAAKPVIKQTTMYALVWGTQVSFKLYKKVQINRMIKTMARRTGTFAYAAPMKINVKVWPDGRTTY